MKYKIIEHQDVETLIDIINTEIEDGWKPQGGVAKGFGNDYMQAMIIE